jgi:hypothetical protein
MVKHYLLYLFFIFSIYSLVGQEISIEALIDENQGIANQPLKGSILITHQHKAKIDPNSFSLNEKPLVTALIKEENISSGEEGFWISIYSFEIPPQPTGLYILNPISVKIGNKTYQSSPVSYEVIDQAKIQSYSHPIPRSPSPFSEKKKINSSSSPLIFDLKAFFRGPSSFYPGQRGKLVYHITYNRNIDLSLSNLPLLHTTEFKKIGDEQIQDYETGSLTHQEITQEIEAFKPGVFYYGPSILEGYPYYLDSFGKKTHQLSLLRAEAPPLTITVNPFPLEQRPASFNGAIGKIEAILKVNSDLTHVALGENIEIQLVITSLSNLQEARLPDLNCQPGFSGFFQLNDLPPLATIKGETKSFTIQLRPISRFVNEIPSIELSSFDPLTAHYKTWRSSPISLKLINLSPQYKLPKSSSSVINMKVLLEELNKTPPPLLIKGSIPTQSDLQIHFTQTYWVLLLIPLGILLIFLQKRIYLYWKSIPHKQAIKSQDLLKKALREKNLKLLQEFFLNALKEKSYTKALFSQQRGEMLDEKVALKVKTFLLHLDTLQYGFPQHWDFNQIKQQANQLWEDLKES